MSFCLPSPSVMTAVVATDLLGAQHVQPFEKELGAEDFGCFLEIVPGAMFLLGTRIEGDERLAHTPRFDIDERALPIGAPIVDRDPAAC